MTISIPKLSLVVLVGPSGSGKSTFARRHFRPTEILSSDACRGMVSDDENEQSATKDAFEVLRFVAAKRLERGRLTVVDATNVQPEARRPLVEAARRYHCLPVAIVLDLPEGVCHERNRGRADREFGPHVVRNQASQLRRSLRNLRKEGFRHVFVLRSPEEVESAVVARVPLWNDRSDDRGPFDVIGDVHGCCDELEALLGRLGYEVAAVAPSGPALVGQAFHAHPEGRKAVFVGDLVDRGPRVLDTVRLVASMVAGGSALCVPGNHDVKLLRKLRGKDVQITHGLAETLAEIDALPDDARAPFVADLAAFLDGLVSHYVLDGGGLVVAHAGMKAEMQGRGSSRVRDFALYGETTGETDEFGLPVRVNWAAEYRGEAAVVYGHTPVPAPEWLNGTVNVDTGCVFGGALTALRWPERAFVSVPAARTYREPSRPFLPVAEQAPAASAQQENNRTLDLEDVIGKRIIPTRLRGPVTIREENAAAALEVMSRFAVDPRWLVYLPPTMSPCETSREAGLLEHPAEAFSYYRAQGAPRVVCQEKHMGSRAVVVACRDEAAARDRFGVEGEVGAVVTRTGRRFFRDADLERAFLDRVRGALTSADVWRHLETSWALLDCELMPWSAKAQELLKSQYAAVGAAGTASLPRAVAALERAAGRLEGEDRAKLREVEAAFHRRAEDVGRFVAAYRRYCWPVAGLAGYKLAPFHLLATEGRAQVDKDHVWHMEILAEICRADPELLLATPYKVVDVTDPASEAEGIAWWEGLTDRGGEGMVVKPLPFLLKGARGLAQPAVKCRGREYLRIIYGPEYTTEANLTRLRSRGLGRKRSLALGEFALGVEALERFVRGEPLRRVHECVFGVLALESEPVDPRL
ncbi:polynucleotide kinase-phosphatase [Paludisphaera mucosa]|uniref:Polynucleotide kinase-phosphatase n=1 Tax=Paludisphaera mucosa TaxID=3030827 RepID=A0ABT6FHU7_9BACT|nr:polynucleotide kinase-phosphatase [Paludisphaera mucosa]MDG3007163.1 polynucleotide kinase-phosphatase [Paludisphaera mucosa]